MNGGFAPEVVIRELIRFRMKVYHSVDGLRLRSALSGQKAEVWPSRGAAFVAAAPALDVLIGIPLLHATYDNDNRWHHRANHRGGHGIRNLSSLR